MTHASPLSALPRAVAEIDTAALSHNYQAVSRVCGKTIAVVKANAYGHGLSLAVPAFLHAGCDFFAVASATEALEVRKLAPFADILLLGYASSAEISALMRARVTLCAFSLPYAEALSRAAGAAGIRATVHLKIDGGMCRLGFAPEDMRAILAALALPHLDVCGIFTHFPEADANKSATVRALSRFLALRNALPVPLFAHAAASAAALSLPEARPDAVRVGLALYGYLPVQAALDLRPAMRVVAPVVQLHRVAAGTRVGYGGDFVCARNSVIGTVPLGYADGFLRALTGLSLTVLCEDRAFTAPIVGRICMDYLMLDLTDLPVKDGETVCILEDFAAAARHAGTIPYELLTAISARVPRCEKGEV
jgi:alanine racemase